jgi:hypothetical protein
VSTGKSACATKIAAGQRLVDAARLLSLQIAAADLARRATQVELIIACLSSERRERKVFLGTRAICRKADFREVTFKAYYYVHHAWWVAAPFPTSYKLLR